MAGGGDLGGIDDLNTETFGDGLISGAWPASEGKRRKEKVGWGS
jgi:hypothetical protein